MKYSILSVIVFLVITSNAQVNFQPGYVIQNNGDTLRGYIDYRFSGRNPETIRFKSTNSGNIQQCTPLTIKEFFVSNELFRSAIVELETSSDHNDYLKADPKPEIGIDTVFLQALFIGQKSLFYLCDNVRKDHFYILRDTVYELLIYKRYLKSQPGNKEGATTVVKNLRFQGQLINYLKDCPSIYSTLSTSNYKKYDMRKLFLTYANCVHTTWQHKNTTKTVHINLSLFTGSTLTTLKINSTKSDFYNTYDYFNKTQFKPSVMPLVGLRLKFYSPRKSGRWAICHESLLTFYKFSGTYNYYESENHYTINNTTIETLYRKFNIYLLHTYNKKNLEYSGHLGVSYGFLTPLVNTIDKEFKRQSSVWTTTGEAIPEIRTLEQAYFLGAGVKYKDFYGDLRYERGNGFSKSDLIQSATNRFYLILGYTF